MTDARREHPTPLLVERQDELAHAAARLSTAPRIALDLESNGMFAYRAIVCVAQIATSDEVVLVDAIATPLTAVGALLASTGTQKILHDVAFDARLLAETGIHLANVRDTAVAARMLGRAATGLAALLSTELGVAIDKKMQQHDWSARPLHDEALEYLAGDVIHLGALADRLFAEVEERGIGDEVEEETRYRLAQAIEAASAPDPRPAYVRLKGIDRAPKDDLPILRHLAEVREQHARAMNVPPYKVLAPDVLFAIAAARPEDMRALERIRGATSGRRARAMAPEILDAVACGIEDRDIPEEDAPFFRKPRLPGAVVRARRGRTERLTRWRRDEARRRGVDEQVVLPGHCLKDLAEMEHVSLDAIAAVPGLGTFRVDRDGASLLATLAISREPEADP